ncbi:hypothetical protein DEO72_LG9g1189 [Vigna unguiculata]|uniref:Uncharacterized protein n=1 Tax=Vigna unguiculata TaxID=3917 RepID=A0A4D6MYR6_VIGUN|nr:hypothetical protein DEO72_LG9g1189 [Vigna unguiculata]
MSLYVGPGRVRRHLTSDTTPLTLSFGLSLCETQKPSRCSSFPREFPPVTPLPTPSSVLRFVPLALRSHLANSVRRP